MRDCTVHYNGDSRYFEIYMDGECLGELSVGRAMFPLIRFLSELGFTHEEIMGLGFRVSKMGFSDWENKS